MIDLLREIGQTLSNNKLRTALTGFAVTWGIFMLIVLLGVSKGVVNSFQQQFSFAGTDQINIWGGITSKPHSGYKEGRRIKLRDGDGEKVVEENSDHVKDFTYRIQDRTAVVSTQRDYTSGYSGVYPSQVVNQNLTLTQGRFINDADMQGWRKVAVLPRSVAQNLLGPDSTAFIGSRITIGGFSFTVIGIYDHRWENNIYIPFTTAKKLTGDKPEVDQITIKIKDVYDMPTNDATEKNIRSTLGRAHDFDSTDSSALWVWNQITQHLQTLSGISMLNIAVWVIGLLTMLTGIVGVSNIMFVSVRERTHEIGVRRAIGAKPRNILVQVITESVIMTAIFGYIGVVCGVIALSIVDHLFSGQGILNPSVDLTVAMEVTVVLVIAGAVAGLFPALKALKIKPVEALRDE